ncbi:unnamed protein product [Somion occarium]|uniref:Galactose oxidase n=1 Tax=Somion occarium TaxID=3059160 RepID=A0ABP1ECP2_9APHY
MAITGLCCGSVAYCFQAASLVQDILYVHGGRTDQFNSYSYSAAPVTNDFFSLSLASSFNTSSPPWQYLSGCSDCSSDQGPAVAWHTLSTFNTTHLLLFGGDPGPNSPISLPAQADSAALLDVSDRELPTWDFQTSSWANEPLRRIYHSASSSNGKIWIVGGSKADGSDSAFSEHLVFDPQTPSFTQLSSTNAPPDIYGHQSVVLPNGWLLVFGGYSPSQNSLLPFTSIWALDTARPGLGWTTLSVSNASLPSPRRGFAATSLNNGKVLIHGGADAELQSTFSDGWILDTTQKPVVWTSVDSLSQLGPRRDHFAVASGQTVIFGFGYARDGPAPSTLSVFDTSSSTFLSTFNPPSPPPSMTTLPGTSPTTSALNPSGSQPPGSSPSGTSPGSQPGSAEFPYPTSTGNTGNNNGNGSPSDPSNPDNPTGAKDEKSHATAIAVGTVFGVLALMVGAAATTWYMRRRHSQESFHLLANSGDDEDSPHDGPILPVAGLSTVREKGRPIPPIVRNVKDRLSTLVPGQHVPSPQDRRDMLADEDTRVFEEQGWWDGGLHRDTSSGRSSFMRPTFGDRVHDSLVSLRTVGGAVLDYAAGSIKKEGSGGSRSTWRHDKEASGPFSDNWGLVKGVSSTRPRGGRQTSSYTYADPFEDYEVESLKSEDIPTYQDEPLDEPNSGFPSLSDPPPRPYLHLVVPRAELDLAHPTPISERPSLSTVTEQSTTPSDSNQSMQLSQFGAVPSTSSNSHEPPRSPRRPSSIIDANPSSPSMPMRRSNSWWTRFSKTPLLDRRPSDTSRRTQPLDFRDPNPPPSRLVPIEEANSPESPSKPGSRKSSDGVTGRVHVYSSHQHGRSASSLQSKKTANSEMIERMGHTMDIVQKGTMSSHGSGLSTSSVEEDRADGAPITKPLSIVTSSGSKASLTAEPDSLLVQSPEQLPHNASWPNVTVRGKSPSPPRQSRSPSNRPTLGGKVAERVQAFERRMSQEEPIKSPPPAWSTKRISYGVVPKPSLFVANPDRSRNSSTDS